MTMSLGELKAAIPASPLTHFSLPEPAFRHVHSGKVRELFECDAGLLLIASDRVSAFDVILPGGIAGKGIVLTQLSRWWFDQTRDLVPNHLIEPQDTALAACLAGHEALIPRAMLVRPLERAPLECVVRGYLAGSGWTEYQATGALWGRPLPAGLRESELLPEPMFTPTTKAAVGGKDEPLTPAQTALLTGPKHASALERLSLALYARGRARAAQAGLLLADTKFEFGQANGSWVLVDEVLTPDSSRYWPADSYAPGRSQASFDKQFVRDYLASLDWDRRPPGPALPADIADATLQKYLDAYQRLVEGD